MLAPVEVSRIPGNERQEHAAACSRTEHTTSCRAATARCLTSQTCGTLPGVTRQPTVLRARDRGERVEDRHAAAHAPLGADLVHQREVDEEIATLAQNHGGGIVEGGHLYSHPMILRQSCDLF